MPQEIPSRWYILRYTHKSHRYYKIKIHSLGTCLGEGSLASSLSQVSYGLCCIIWGGQGLGSGTKEVLLAAHLGNCTSIGPMPEENTPADPADSLVQ